VALSDEQQAMLRLLAQGEQGYADIAALMGLSEEEVRAKVVGALAQLQAEGKPAPDVPPPVPGGAKPAVEVTAPEPEPVAEAPAATEASAEPAIANAVAPSAGADGPPGPKPAPAEPTAAKSAAESQPAKSAAQPTAAETRPKESAAKPTASRPDPTPTVSPPPSGRPPSGGRTITLPTGRNAWLLGGGIVAAIVVIVVVVLLASGGGGGSSSTASTEAATTHTEEGGTEPAASSNKLTEAKLTAVDGSEAAGVATFGRVKNKLALQIEATGLEPTTEGTNSYTVWLAQSPQRMLPLASTAVKATGKGANEIAAQFEVPVEILGYLASGTFDQIAITRTDNKQLEAAIEAATKQKKAPAYSGEEVLRGTITGPIIGLAVREEEQKKAEEEGK
jgi:hypothetical protein